GEVLRDVERGLVEALDHRERQRRAVERVAVRRRLRRELGRGNGVAAGAVLHDHRLAERLGQVVRERARQRVVEGAGRGGEDVADRARRPGLRSCRTKNRKTNKCRQNLLHSHGGKSLHCSAFTPAVLMTLAHLAISSRRNLPASSGELPTGSMPIWLKRSLISDSLIALRVSAER